MQYFKKVISKELKKFRCLTILGLVFGESQFLGFLLLGS